LSDLETNAGELTNEVIPLRIESEHGFFADVAKVKGRFLKSRSERVETISGDSKLYGTKRDDDIETLFEDPVIFDQTLDKLTILDNCLFDFLRLNLLDAIIQKLNIFGDVFSLRANEELNRKGKGVDEGGIGIDGRVLFFIGEKAKVDGGGLKDKRNTTVFEIDQVILDGVDVEMFLSRGFDVRH